MKKSFYSIWIRAVFCCFWTMVWTFMIIGFLAHLMNRFHLLDRLSKPLTGVHLLLVLALASTILGVFISIFVFRYAMNPIIELSQGMQKVTKGDYTVKLRIPEVLPKKGEMYELLEHFNTMVQELNSTETLHSDFISNVSHEFKTPLASISGYATLLQDDTLTPQERDEYIETIITSAKELSHMTGNILSLSRLENQSIITDQHYFRVDEQIRQCILQRETLWFEKNLLLEPDLQEISWYGNQELTSHIWNNLLDNAIKFTSAGGEIDISASMDERWLTVSIKDSGIGIPSEIQSRIFDKFYQGDTSHKKKGNGLGLALVHQIVTLYGGHISLESIPDLGSTFTVQLPAHPSSEPQSFSS